MTILNQVTQAATAAPRRMEVERADFASHFDVVGTILPIHLNGRVVAPHESMEQL